jgi:hypothetical protein
VEEIRNQLNCEGFTRTYNAYRVLGMLNKQ